MVCLYFVDESSGSHLGFGMTDYWAPLIKACPWFLLYVIVIIILYYY